MKFFRWFSLATSLSAVIVSAAHANDDWWFDVEVIAFKRNLALSELEEQFTLAKNLEAPTAAIDIIDDVIRPDISWLKQGLKTCGVDEQPQWSEHWFQHSGLAVPNSDVDFLALPKQPQPLEDISQDAQTAGFPEDELISQREHKNGESKSGYEMTHSLSANTDTQFEAQSPPPSVDNLSTDTRSMSGMKQDVATNIDLIQTQEQTSADIVAQYDGATSPAKDTVEAIIRAPDPIEIAQYWLSFFGIFSFDNAMLRNTLTTDSVLINTAAVNTPVMNKTTQNNSVHVPEFSFCEPPTAWMTIDYSAINTSTYAVWQVNKPDNRLPVPSNLPIIIEGYDWPNAASAHLLSSSQQSLSSISRQIRSNRDLERLFHVTWRQQVMFGKDNAFDIRLYGGQNYASQFEMSGKQRPLAVPKKIHGGDNVIGNQNSSSSLTGLFSQSTTTNEVNKDDTNHTSEDDIFTSLNTKLASPEYIPFSKFEALDVANVFNENKPANTNDTLQTPIWEIDGTMKVFLKYINRVPYLHIDSELFFRQPVPLRYFSNAHTTPSNEFEARKSATDETLNEPASIEYKLVSIPLVEQRRVISKQLHYFDHPLFGFIVQIRRYNRPSIDEDE